MYIRIWVKVRWGLELEILVFWRLRKKNFFRVNKLLCRREKGMVIFCFLWGENFEIVVI